MTSKGWPSSSSRVYPNISSILTFTRTIRPLSSMATTPCDAEFSKARSLLSLAARASCACLRPVISLAAPSHSTISPFASCNRLDRVLFRSRCRVQQGAEPAFAGGQSLLCLLAPGDIARRAEPFDDFAVRILQRDRTRERPAQSAVHAQDPVFQFEDAL